MHEFEKEFYVDSTLIANKLGIDLCYTITRNF